MNSWLPVILPLGALLGVATVVISLGLLFISLGGAGTIIVGLAIIVLVPTIGALLTRGSEGSSG